MQSKILVTATLLALTFVGRAFFEPDSGKAATEYQPEKLPSNGAYEDFGGEFQIKLTLHRQGDKWNLVKTDEVTDAEAHQPEQLKAFASGFTQPEPSTYVTLIPPVREYFYYRKQAVLRQDINKLWTRYPQLRQGIDKAAGLNIIPWTASTASLLKPIDGNIDSERYEPMKVKVNGEQVEVIVRGLELYMYQKTTNEHH